MKIVISIAATLALLLAAPRVRALDPSRRANTYITTRFAVDTGMPGNLVDDIVQSRDGFLWLNVQSELVRFDGRRFTQFDNIGGVSALALSPEGDLWIGSLRDLKRIPAASLGQSGELPAIRYPTRPGSHIICLHFSRSGNLWVGADDGLYRLEQGALSSVAPLISIYRIEEAAGGRLLLATGQGFMEWEGGRTIPHPELAAQLGVGPDKVFHVLEDSRGVTWFCTEKGVARRVGGVIEKLSIYGPGKHGAFRAYEDKDGNVWIAKREGLFRATAAGLELVAAGMDVRSMVGDREGDLWVGTNGDGLYRFKDRAVRMFTTADGLPNNLAMTVLATHDGAVWSGFNCGGISRFDGYRFHNYSEKDGLSNSCVWALAEDAGHNLWIGTYGGGAFRFSNGHFTQYSKAEGLASGAVTEILPARDGSLWFATPAALSRWRNGQIRNYSKADGLSGNRVRMLYEDRAGVLWVGTDHGVDRLVGEQFVKVSSIPDSDALPIGEDQSGAVYVSVMGEGTFLVDNGRSTRIIPEQELDVVAGAISETPQGELWLMGDRLYRILPASLPRQRPRDEPLDAAEFHTEDGLAATQPSAGKPFVSTTSDGKLWVATSQGLAMLDLLHLPQSATKPLVYMQEVTVGRNRQPPGSELLLAPGTRHLELRFGAVEISSPEKIHLQYRLDGVDSNWLDAEIPAPAIYTSIPPGVHAFRIRACNRRGIWDRAGIVYTIIQQPYFYETIWFRLSLVMATLLLLWGLYRLRLRQAAARLHARLEERVVERTRIARELHDTLLQSFNAVLLRFQAVSNVLPGRPEEAKQRFDSAIQQAEHAITEGRDAVHKLRAGGLTAVDLAESISGFGAELLSASVNTNAPAFRVQVEGTPRNLNPIIRDEVYRITAEALRNAIRHSGGERIEVEIRYDEQQLRLRIRDNGKGIDPAVLGQGYVSGHWGLRGMRERAKLIGGNFEVWSQVGSGTEIELTIPAASGYARPASGRFQFLKSPWK